MSRNISRFQSISRHEAALRQPTVVIECLVNVLNYIKSVLDDDSTQTLLQMVNHHFETKNITAHYVNTELLSNQIISSLREAFKDLGIYTKNQITDNQVQGFYDHFYDDSVVIPTDYKEFVMWLISNPNIYVDTVPTNYDALAVGITARLAEEWFAKHHDNLVNAHANTISGRLDKMLSMSKTPSSYWLMPTTFMNAYYRLIDPDDFNNLMILLKQRLISMGSPYTVDYTTYPDGAEVSSPLAFIEMSLIIKSFFESMYPELDPNGKVDIIQLHNDSLEALASGGTDTYIGYKEFLADYGETDGMLINRKFINYYVNHLSFVLNDNMTPEYQAILTTIRHKVNTNYSKVFNVFTILNRNGYSFDISCNIDTLAKNKTLDIINLIGLSKSIVCLCLVPYSDNLGIIHNKLVISFDNYNPDFTAVLIDDVSSDELTSFNLAVSVSKTLLSVYIAIGDSYQVFTFQNIGRMYDVDPHFFFVVPRIAEFLRSTIRLTSLRLYGKALSNADAVAVISGFQKH